MGKDTISALVFCVLLLGLGGCGGSSSSAGPTLNLPDLPVPPVSRLQFGTDYVGFMIANQPISTDPSTAQSQQYSQYLYEIDGDANITPVPFFDATDTLIDLTGNLSFTSEENLIPLDVMVMSPDYLLLTVFSRNFDQDPDNDYYNLLVDLHNGSVVAAPVGLNQQGNSGRSSLTQLGRDYFPPDSRWNDTSELYVVSVDYEALDLMEAGELQDFEPEPVDHHNGVPCPPDGSTDEDEPESEDDTTTDDTTTDNTTTDDTATDDTQTDDTTTEDTVTDDTTEQDDATTEEPTPSGPTCSDPSESPVVTNEDAGSATTTEPIVEANTTTEEGSGSFDGDGNPLDNGQDPVPTLPEKEPQEPDIPTAVYRMTLASANQYQLIKVSADGDRPGLGQFIASRSGILIYRNDDGGDNSYRVILSNCENVTGRLSTVLIAPNSTLVVADDTQGNSQIYEITQRGANRLQFSCNGDVQRIAHTAYTTGVNSLRLPYNSPSIASYDYQYPFFVENACYSGRLFPTGIPVTEIVNPMPPVLGLPSSDPRGLRKSQFFGDNLYCIGYDASLEVAVAQLDTTTEPISYTFLPFNFGSWLPSFDTIHVASSTQVLFTGNTRFNPTIRTIMLNIDGTETDLSDSLGGLKVGQQIEITPPPLNVYTLPSPSTDETIE